jgi:type II secretory pathway pseudopilin PulG
MTSREQGFTYLGLLFAVALAGAVLAQIGQHWSGVMQRERERELIFRGQQIAAAIASYRAAPAVAEPAWPSGFEELLEDRRTATPRRHLRRVFTDPITGQADWVPVLDDAGGWHGVHSRSEAPASIRFGAEPPLTTARKTKVSDHLFVAAAAAKAPASSPASSPTGSEPPPPEPDVAAIK